MATINSDNWEAVSSGETPDTEVYRKRVFGGWLVLGNDVDNSLTHMTFVPDGLHEWELDS